MINNYWVNNYPMHVPSTIKLGNDTLISLLRQIVEKVPKNRAITCHGVNFNYEKFYAKVLLFAMALVKKGIQKGDRVAIMLPNSLQYPIAMFGILFAGAVVVNINPLYTEYEISYILEDSGSKAIIVLDLMAGKLNHLYDKFNLEFVVVTKIPDLYHSVKKFLMNLGIKYIKKLKVDYNYNACQFREMLQDNLPTKVGESKNIGSPMPVGLPQVGFDDLAFIQYTGATTGRPKGAMLSHDNIVANYKQCVAWLTPQVDPLNKHVVLNALPLYHIFSMTANLFTFLFCGSEIVMVMNPRDTCDLVNVMRKTKFNTFNALDTLYTHLMDSKYFLKFRYPYFKYSVCGGMATRLSTAKKWFALTKTMPSNCYGLTEASPAVTMNVMDNTFDGSVGFPLPSTLVEIRNLETNSVLGAKEIGTIWIKGPQVMKAYWNNPEQTKKTFDECGFLNTHDIGYLDERGKLYISSRETDMIIVSGFNVYPSEVEAILDEINEIKEVAVIKGFDANSLEIVVAFIVFNNKCSLSEPQIITLCKKKLASYKIPHKFIFIEDVLPKTSVGKIDKMKLFDSYLI